MSAKHFRAKSPLCRHAKTQGCPHGKRNVKRYVDDPTINITLLRRQKERRAYGLHLMKRSCRYTSDIYQLLYPSGVKSAQR